jgi:hypothetical protein
MAVNPSSASVAVRGPTLSLSQRRPQGMPATARLLTPQCPAVDPPSQACRIAALMYQWPRMVRAVCEPSQLPRLCLEVKASIANLALHRDDVQDGLCLMAFFHTAQRCLWLGTYSFGSSALSKWREVRGILALVWLACCGSAGRRVPVAVALGFGAALSQLLVFNHYRVYLGEIRRNWHLVPNRLSE